MKAFVKVRPEPGGAEYIDFDVPQVGPGDVLIEVKAAGICGTEIILRWDITAWYIHRLRSARRR